MLTLTIADVNHSSAIGLVRSKLRIENSLRRSQLLKTVHKTEERVLGRELQGFLWARNSVGRVSTMLKKKVIGSNPIVSLCAMHRV